MKHVWSVLCERVSTDRATNTLSLLTCLEELTVAEVPAAVPNATIGTLWFKESDGPEQLSIRFSVENPEGLLTVLHEGQLEVTKQRQRANLAMANFTFKLTGVYFFRVYQEQNTDEWVEVSCTPVVVRSSSTVSDEQAIGQGALGPEAEA